MVVEQIVKKVEAFDRVEQQLTGKDGLSERTAVLEEKVGTLRSVVTWCIITVAAEILSGIAAAIGYAIYYAVSHK